MKGLQLIAAVASNGVIGCGADLPWCCSEDVRHFRKLTMGHVVIIGRRTWDGLCSNSAPGQDILPGRKIIIVSRDIPGHIKMPGGARLASSVEEAIAKAFLSDDSPFIAGGAQVYAAAMRYVRCAHITELGFSADGDVYMPEYSPGADRPLGASWDVGGRRKGTGDMAFLVLTKKESVW